jgi:hypothetical protein
MKRLTPFIWIIAWCVWLWLGFGLYRELPRDLGPVVCNLKLSQGERVTGFDAERPEVIVAKKDYSAKTLTLSAFDPHTGERIREIGTRPDVGFRDNRGRKELRERNQILMNDWWNVYLPGRWNTLAIRDLETGWTVTREWEREARLIMHENAEQTLVVDARGVIYRYPMVNWARLVFCQTMLAVPLILRWWLPRWWKKRMARGGRESPGASQLSLSASTPGD